MSKTRRPSALPKHWPHPSPTDLEALPRRLVYLGQEQQFNFRDNRIKTSKYEWWNFLPKFLMEEFQPKTKFANCYFLMIAGLQTIPQITNTSGYPTTLIPLLGVLMIAAVLKSVEDLARHRADKKANSSETEVLDLHTMQFKKILWSEVKVGDYVRVKSRETIPADCIVLQSSEPNEGNPKGVCFVETKQLDGETNLKIRLVVPSLLGKFPTLDDLAAFKAKVEMEHPNNLIDHFSGVMESSQAGRVPILPVNVILRGCVLRSTDWMIGCVVNTGHDVKIMQSKLDTRTKSSNLETLATKQILGVIVLLALVCIGGATAEVVYNARNNINDHWYLDWNPNPAGEWFIKLFSMVLLHSTFIPVALYVSMATVRFMQSKFMQYDEEMYYEPLDAPLIVRTMTLNEELGQITHIFSDKTGTLTCNVLNFRKASINGVSYGKGITEIGRAAWKLMNKPVPEDVLEAERRANENAIPHVAFYCPDFEKDAGFSPTNASGALNNKKPLSPSNNNNPVQRQKILEFYRYLAVCHEVIAERLESGKTKLSAPNPDDEALVNAAGYFAYRFIDRHDRFVELFDIHQQCTVKVEVLYTIPFTSARKRMSVIIRDIDNKVKIITKGADTMMYTRLSTQDNSLTEVTTAQVNQYSIEGLRCLVIATGVIDEEKFTTWSRRYDQANTNLDELEKRKNGEDNQIEVLEDYIERDLHIIGATAIEDRLQEGVPETIEKLTNAGIKVWVLTGDKEETAINIAVACNLVLPKEYMHQVLINSNNAPNVTKACEILTKELFKYLRESGFSPGSALKSTDPNELRNSTTAAVTATSPVDIYSEPSDFSFVEHLQVEDIGALTSSSLPRSLIIDGPSLIPIMQDNISRKLLLLFTQCCQAVVCCRVSPDQKRQILELVKKNIKESRTLAVGDGANDVAMITAAHLGVGIKGEEGVQAVNASDYAIAQFRYLLPLLLKHGRYNYINMSNMICFMFYKNILMSMPLFWYSCFNALSEVKFYTEAAIQLYNLFYTSVPIIMYCVYDRDIAYSTVKKFPQLYRSCIENRYFTDAIFWGNILDAFVESVFVALMPVALMRHFDFHDGMLASHSQIGATVFTCVVILCNLKIFKFEVNWYWGNLLAIFCSVLSWIIIATLAARVLISDPNFYGLWVRLMASGVFWLTILLIVGTIVMKDLAISYIQRQFYFTNEHLLQELDNDVDISGGNFTLSTKNRSPNKPAVDHMKATQHNNSIDGEAIEMQSKTSSVPANKSTSIDKQA